MNRPFSPPIRRRSPSLAPLFLSVPGHRRRYRRLAADCLFRRGLPNWAQISSAGVLSGTPSTDGTFDFSVIASNGILPNTSVNVSLIIARGTAVTLQRPRGNNFQRSHRNLQRRDHLQRRCGCHGHHPERQYLHGRLIFNVAPVRSSISPAEAPQVTRARSSAAAAAPCSSQWPAVHGRRRNDARFFRRHVSVDRGPDGCREWQPDQHGNDEHQRRQRKGLLQRRRAR